MHTGRRYGIAETLRWTRRDIYLAVVLSVVPTLLVQLLDARFITIPWIPIAIVATAAAFAVGFKNTQTYNRVWEARQIWGSIVNSSRIFGMRVKDFIKTGSNVHHEIIQRHCAWLTALRYQLRAPRSWESSKEVYSVEYQRHYEIQEWMHPQAPLMKDYLSPEEYEYISGKKNQAAQLIALQSKHISSLKEEGKIGQFEYIELEKTLADLYDHQGRCERIKNFPYPRQFATVNFFFIRLLIVLLPLGMLHEFSRLGDYYPWLTIPCSVIISWIYTTMGKVGESTENPFEGSPNDVPISTISRQIEIDLKDMLDEKTLPEPLAAKHNILM